MVQAQATGCSLMETFTQGQRQVGDNHLAVVNSIDEAHALLGLDTPHFEDIG
jgi:hypothetical protein